MSFNSKYSGQQVENLLDQVANGNAGGGGGGITTPLYPIEYHTMDDDNVSLDAGKYHMWPMPIDSLTISLGRPSGAYCPHWIFRFTSGTNGTTLTLPDGIVWANGNEISISANKTYEISITEGLGVWVEFNTL